ncbi:unnamed protein product [Adineta ricciae]|uniref:Uncharacterized protein n=1 Tax=Adineta ricciae TaxID=249248 RepID=A0A814DFT7_ADIRI|nr:unnamed protein product [Adineta ricciae]CAF0953937.1 unnamed protein product [Adineta ricciae]
MSDYFSYSAIIFLLICLHNQLVSASILGNRSLGFKNGSSLNARQRISSQAERFRQTITSVRDRYDASRENHDESVDEERSSPNEGITSVVVLTSLSGIYVWWPTIFGGDDSFHLLLTQEDVPRFHDVAGDEHGHIYLTSPHERTVYRLQYSDGWWISNFSNHSVMNSIRSEMPLFLSIHHVSSILYVYGHSDIQIIDLLQKPRTRGSAPFMKRLRELSPNLRISDMIIDQVTADGYIIGDSYGWCTIIRCSLSVNECVFLFKIPSSYDNRPYPCIATIDFSTKIMYLSLEEKILAIHLNEYTNYDRREILAEKQGPRSTLGYDDIVTHQNILLYTDVLRPLLHICMLTHPVSCLNMSLIFPSSQRTILPLRLSIIQVPNLRPPHVDDDDEIELHINQSITVPSAIAALVSNRTSEHAGSNDDASSKSYVHKETIIGNIWMLILGICIGLLLAGVSFMIYYVIWNKNRPRLKTGSNSLTIKRPFLQHQSFSKEDRANQTKPKYQPMVSQSTTERSNIYVTDSLTETSSELTTCTTSSSSYRPDTIL